MSNGDRPAHGWRPWRVLVLAVAALTALALAERFVPWLRNRGPDGTGRAKWIWSDENPYAKAPTAFFAARDFDLATVPPGARLLVAADEEYLLYLNGARVGSNRWRPGSPLDAYAVASLLRSGRNRVAVELRSENGIGGCIVRLEAGPGLPDLLGSGRSWRILRTAGATVLDGPAPLRGELPVLWGRSPLGRWNSPRAVPRPLFSQLAEQAPPLKPERFQALEPGSTWLPWARWGKRGARRPQVLLDWGQEVTGYLNLRFRDGESRVGLAWIGLEPPEPRREAVADVVLVTVRGRGSWHDSVPRRFRYVALVGVRGLEGVQVQGLRPGVFAGLEPPALSGVFGLPAAPLRAPVEDEIWRQLEGGAGRAVRQRG